MDDSQDIAAAREPYGGSVARSRSISLQSSSVIGPVAGLVGIEVGVVSGVINLESPSVEAPGRRPRHEECYQQA
jgi:hypothetical protein